MPSPLGDLISKLPDPLGIFGSDRGGGMQIGQNGGQGGPDALNGDGPDHPSPADGNGHGNGNGYAYGHDGAPGNSRGMPQAGVNDGGHPSGPPGLPSLPGAPATSMPAGPSPPTLNAGPILSLVQQVALLPAAIVSTLFGQNIAPPPTPSPQGTPGVSSQVPSTPSSAALPGGGQGVADARAVTPNVVTAVQTASQVVPAVVQGTGQLQSTLAQAIAPGATLAATNPQGDARALGGAGLAGGQPAAVVPQSAGSLSAANAQATSVVPFAAAQAGVAAANVQTAATAPAAIAATLASASAASLPAAGSATLAQAAVVPAAAQTLAAGNPAQFATINLPVPSSVAADRLGAAPMGSLPSAVPTAFGAAGTTASPAQIGTLANAPLAQLPAVDPRAALPLGPGDRGQVVRAEQGMIAGYTGDGLQRRPLRSRLDSLLTSPMNQLLAALGAAGDTSARRRDEAEQQAQLELERALQWVFWVLAIVAYGSLAFTLIALMAGSGSGADIAARVQQDGNGWLAGVGLGAGIAAWWVARRIGAR